MNPARPDTAYSSRGQQTPAIPATAAPNATDDLTLIQRMQGGDEPALGLFYDKWMPAVYSLIAGLLKDRDEAEDVVEETFWQVWRQAGSYNPARGSVPTWLLTIARSRALDKLRSRQRQRTEPLSDSVIDIPALSDPSADAEISERAMFIAAALKELPEEQRQALYLAYFRGMTQSEIAESTSQPLGTIKTRMRLGMQKMRERLAVLRNGTIDTATEVEVTS